VELTRLGAAWEEMEMEVEVVAAVDCRVARVRILSCLAEEILSRISAIRIISSKLNRGDTFLQILSISSEEVREMEEGARVLVVGIGDDGMRLLICKISMCLL